MRFDSLVGHALELYPLAAQGDGAAERAVAHFFHGRRYLGSRDRAGISELVWGLLRLRVRALALDRAAGEAGLAAMEVPEVFRHLIWGVSLPGALGEAARRGWPVPGEEESWRGAISAAATRNEQVAVPELLERVWDEAGEFVKSAVGAFGGDATNGTGEGSAITPENVDLALGFPAWLAQQMAAGDPEGWINEARALLDVAPLTLRVNSLFATRAKVIEELAALEPAVLARETELSPEGIALAQRINLDTLAAYQAGLIEVQDEGSQYVAAALGAEPGWRVLDACTGGGGKALHLAALMGNEGQVLACDLDERRTEALRRRAVRASATSIKIVEEKKARTFRDLDAVLVDAPCSGLGTLRRRPDLLFKASLEDVETCGRIQAELLNVWSRVVRPGGVVVYATCTFARQENDDVVAKFLEGHGDFTVEDPLVQWQAWHEALGAVMPEVVNAGWTGLGRQLTPGRQGCDAFYIARLRRTMA